MNNEKLKGHFFIFVSSLLFAVNLPVSKYLLPSHVTPDSLTLLRVAFACFMFWATSLFIPREKTTPRDIALLFVCSLCGIVLNQGLFIHGLNMTSPVDASIIATEVPVFVMILAALVLKEPITWQKTAGVLLGIAGAVSLILQSAEGETGRGGSLGGNMMVVSSGLAYSVYLVMSKPLTQRYSSVTIMKWMFLFATLMLAPFSFDSLPESPVFHHRAADYGEIAAVFYVLMGATFIPYLLIPMALKRIRPTTVSMYNYVQPIVASFLAVWIGQDSFSVSKLFSSLLVFTGVYLVTQSKSRADMERQKPPVNG